ncbi:hypothetical protein PVK06_040049 [Gossypium arboreum]|uniref:Uncharacterized protein n=1 Tax=Gossypium arboreum TaxID=29729 RepID=A0ABR0N770_GOSAR|nr:hypothetical protein PVK06_040049 [Gossypium arboreum]
MCLIHSVVKGRKIDVGAILHQEFACIVRKTVILVFPSLVMLLCQQKGIVPRDDDEVLDNKGPINESSIERKTCGKDTPTMKEVETSKMRKGKTKAKSKGTNLTTETTSLHKKKDIEKLANSISNKQIRLGIETDRWHSLIVHVSVDKKEKESIDIGECIQKTDSLVEHDFIIGQKEPTVEEEVAVREEEVLVEDVNKKNEEKDAEK